MNVIPLTTRPALVRGTACRLAAAFTLVMALAGCASTPAPILLTLPPAVTTAPASVAVNAQTRPPLAQQPVLSLARIGIPEYVVSRRVRYRTNDSTLAEWPDTYWAERIEVSLSRELVAALHQQLPGWRICETSCAEQAPAAALQVVISRMDYLRSERRLRASVRLVLTSTERLPRALHDEERSYEIQAGGDDAQAHAGAYTQLLVKIAADAASLVAQSSAGVASKP